MLILSIALTVQSGFQRTFLQMVHSVKPTHQHVMTLVTLKKIVSCVLTLCGEVIGDCTYDYLEHLIYEPGSSGWFPGYVVWTGLLPYWSRSRPLEWQLESKLHVVRSMLWCPSYCWSLWISATRVQSLSTSVVSCALHEHAHDLLSFELT